MGLTDLSEYIPKLITAIGQFLSTGIMFYICSILVFAVILNTLISFVRTKKNK